MRGVRTTPPPFIQGRMKKRAKMVEHTAIGSEASKAPQRPAEQSSWLCLPARPHFNVTHQLCYSFCLTCDKVLHCCDSCAVHIPQTCSWYQKSTGASCHVLFVSFSGLTSTIAAFFYDHYHRWGQPFPLLKYLLCVYKINKPSCLPPSETRLV